MAHVSGQAGERKIFWRSGRDKTFFSRNSRRIRFWRPLTVALSWGKAVPERRLNGWLLVLEAKKIPHVFSPAGERPLLYVPALYEQIAVQEIQALERERPMPDCVPPVRENRSGVLLLFLALVVWHGLRWNWFSFHLPSPPFPSAPGGWSSLFGLDVYRVRALHEWWRTATALTLHADETHLLSNLGFGLLFLIPLCRRAGLGLGMLLTLVAGILGNTGNALTRNAGFVSLGFSTALFGAVGILCALSAADMFRNYRSFLLVDPSSEVGKKRPGLLFSLIRRPGAPLAAGLALLGILGGGAEARTDYAAHIWGFCCGVACALCSLPFERKLFSLPAVRQSLVQSILLLTALTVLFAAWLHALRP